MTGSTGSIVGRFGGFTRRYPGGSAWDRIFFSVSQWIAYCLHRPA